MDLLKKNSWERYNHRMSSLHHKAIYPGVLLIAVSIPATVSVL
jgi:hypothetical protein